MYESLKGQGKHCCHPRARLSETPQTGSSNLCYLTGAAEKSWSAATHRKLSVDGGRLCGRHCSCLQWWIMGYMLVI